MNDIETIEYLMPEFGSVTIESGNLALKELEEGRRVVILFPKYLSCAVFEMGRPPEGIFLRFDSERHSLMSLAVDTIILVRPSDLKNAQFAIDHMLFVSKNPKIIKVGS